MIVPRHVATNFRKVAVLTPAQVLLIEDKLNSDYKIRTRFLLETEVRIAEGKYLAEHPECYRVEDGMIDLPHVKGLGKKRCTIKQRTIFLSTKGVNAVNEFYNKKVGLPAYQSMEPAIKLAAEEADFDKQYITTKMYRKTFISWMITCLPHLETKILHSSGHDLATMRGSYLALGFRKDDVKDMQEWLAGWGEIA